MRNKEDVLKQTRIEIQHKSYADILRILGLSFLEVFIDIRDIYEKSQRHGYG